MNNAVAAAAGLYLVGYAVVSFFGALRVKQIETTGFRDSPVIWFARIIVDKFAKETQKRVKLAKRVLLINSAASLLVGLWTFFSNILPLANL